MLHLLVFIAALGLIAIGALIYLMADKIRSARAEPVALNLAHRAKGRACAAQSSEIDTLANHFMDCLTVQPAPFVSREGSDS